MITPDTHWDLFLGYTAFWICLGWFVFTLIREQRSLRREMDELKTELSRMTTQTERRRVSP